MVARDGIEPPTPAFSGPRSTTELPGLSADLSSCNFLCGIPAKPEEVGVSTNSALQQLCEYINSPAQGQASGPAWPCRSGTEVGIQPPGLR